MQKAYEPWKKISERVKQAPLGEEEKLRLRHFFVFLFLGLPAMLLFGLYNAVIGDTTLGLVCLFTAIVLSFSGVLLLQTTKANLVYRCCTTCYLCLLLYSLYTGGDDGSKSIWIFTFPLVTFFLLGKREGVMWSTLFGVIIVISMTLAAPLIYPYSGEFTIRLLTVYLFVATIAYWFEHFRDSFNRQLNQKNLIFQETLDHSRDILYRRDIATGRYQYISKAFTMVLGYSSIMEFEKINDIIHPDDRERHSQALQSLMSAKPNSEQEITLEYRMRHKNGDYLWFSDMIQVISDNQGQPEFILGINREITLQRQARQSLKQMRDRLYTILNGIDAHVYVADMTSYRVLFMNNKMIEDFGGNLVGDICWQSFRNLQGPCDHCTNSRLLDEHNKPTGVVEWEDYNPVTKRWYKNHDRAVLWLDGKWVRIQIALDITRLKEMETERLRNEEALRKSRHLEAIGTLAAGIAHDFNNLFQSILGYCELIEFDPHYQKSNQHYTKETKNALFKAIELANYLKSFSSGGVPIVSEVKLHDLILPITDTLKKESEIDMEISIPSHLPPVLIDQQQMTIALGNLIKNGLESMSHNAPLQISARLLNSGEHKLLAQGFSDDFRVEADQWLEVHIQDSGRGIPPGDLEKIFDPYYSTKELGSTKGQGLGLSIAQSIIQRHGGTLVITSKEDIGTTAVIVLPSL